MAKQKFKITNWDLQPHRNSEELMTLIDSINHSGKGSVWFSWKGIKRCIYGLQDEQRKAFPRLRD